MLESTLHTPAVPALFRTRESGGLPGPCRRPGAVRHGLNLTARRLIEAAWKRHEQSGRPLPPVEARPQATIGSDPTKSGEPRAPTYWLRLCCWLRPYRRWRCPAGWRAGGSLFCHENPAMAAVCCNRDVAEAPPLRLPGRPLTIYELRSAAPYSPYRAVPRDALSRPRPRPPGPPLAAGTGRPLCLVVAVAAPPPPLSLDDAPLRPPRPPPRSLGSPRHFGRPRRPALGRLACDRLPPLRPNGDSSEMPRAERGNERQCRSCAVSRSPLTSDQRERPSEKWRATHLAGAVLVARKGSGDAASTETCPLLCYAGREGLVRCARGVGEHPCRQLRSMVWIHSPPCRAATLACWENPCFPPAPCLRFGLPAPRPPSSSPPTAC